MIDVCVHEESEELDLTFNAKKSFTVQVGKTYTNECAAVKLLSYVILIYLFKHQLGILVYSCVLVKHSN